MGLDGGRHLLLTVVVYVATAMVGIELTGATGGVATLWLANAAAIALLRLRPASEWPAGIAVLGITVLATNIAAGDTAHRGFGFAVGNMVEIAAALYLLRRLCPGGLVTGLIPLFRFTLVSGLLSPGAGALVAGLLLETPEAGSFLAVAAPWFGAGALGQFVVLPLVDQVMSRRNAQADGPVAFEGPGLWLTASAVAMLAFGLFVQEQEIWLFLLYPVMVAVTLRHGVDGAAAACSLTAAAAVAVLALGYDPVGAAYALTPSAEGLAVQLLLFTLTGSVLLVGAALATAERMRAEAVQARLLAEQASRGRLDFLAVMSHELRTPLNAIVGFSDLMRSQPYGPLGDSRYSTYVEDIHASGQHLVALIGDVLDIAKVDTGDFSVDRVPGPLARPVAEAVDIVRGMAARKGQRLVVDLDRAVTVEGDPVRLRQAALNLLSNAVKYTQAGGRIAVTVSAAEGLARLRVADNGPGMSASDVARAGRRFWQSGTDPAVARQGAGLGLMITRAIAAAHDGSLTLESAQGTGTVATFSLRVAPS